MRRHLSWKYCKTNKRDQVSKAYDKNKKEKGYTRPCLTEDKFHLESEQRGYQELSAAMGLSCQTDIAWARYKNNIEFFLQIDRDFI